MSNTAKIFKKLFISHLLLNITNYLSNILNGIVAGKLIDSIAVSFNSLIVPYNRLLLTFAFLYSTGSEIVCGKYMGSGDRKSINKVFTTSIILSSIIGIAITIPSFVFPNRIVSMLGASNEINEYAATYLRGYAIGNLSYILIPILSSFLHIEDEGKQIIKSVIIMTITYGICSFCFIEVLSLGYFGFGLSTSISKIVTVLYLFIKIYKNRKQIYFEKFKFDFSVFIDIHKYGLVSGISNLLLSQRGLIFNQILANNGGVTSLSAYSVSVSVLSIVDSFTLAIIQTFSLLSSVYIGERNKKELLNTFKYFFKCVYPIYFVVLLIHFIFAKQICSLFTNDIDSLILGCHMARLYLPSALLESIINILMNLYIVFKHNIFANILNILHSCVLHSAYAIATQSFLSCDAVNTGYIFTEITSFLIIYIYVIIQKKRILLLPEDFLLLDDTMNDTNKLNITIDSYEQAINVSIKVIEYCISNGINKKNSNKCGLCVEEIVTNIFEHGFTKKDVKNKRIDIFVIVDSNDVSIRIRDNSIAFNPLERSLIFNPEDPCKNVGIRLVSKISKEFTYNNIFGLNNTIIKI